MLKVGWVPPDPDSGEKQGVDDLLAKGATIEDIECYLRPFTGCEIVTPGWPILGEEAYYGLPGKIVKEILPHTEADAAALLFSLLTYVGCMIGRGPTSRLREITTTLKRMRSWSVGHPRVEKESLKAESKSCYSRLTRTS
jgi:hypothetical protein